MSEAAPQTKYLLQSLHQWRSPTHLDVLEVNPDRSVLFSKFEDARDCMRTLQFDAIDQYGDENTAAAPLADESMLVWRFLIQEVLFDDDEESTEIDLERYRAFEKTRKVWCYNVEDSLLWVLPDPNAEKSDFERFAMEGKFTLGDVVRILPQALDPNSASMRGDYGVILEVPISKDAWLQAEKSPNDWDASYTINYVDAFGLLDEYRLPERCLAPLADEVPKEYAFLPIWAKFLMGKATFPDGLADRIRARKVHLLNIPRYDFEKNRVEQGEG